MTTTDPRTHLAFLIWCMGHDYLRAEDRSWLPNWLLSENLTSDQIGLRWDLLTMADEVLAALGDHLAAENVALSEQIQRMEETASPAYLMGSDDLRLSDQARQMLEIQAEYEDRDQPKPEVEWGIDGLTDQERDEFLKAIGEA